MNQLKWTRRASADLRNILRYYNDVDFALGETLFGRIVAASRPLIDQPGLGSVVGHHGTRKWRVKRTPFVLLYRISKNRTVEILRVHHAAQNWRPE